MRGADYRRNRGLFSERYLDEGWRETARDDLDEATVREVRADLVDRWGSATGEGPGRVDGRSATAFVDAVCRQLDLPVGVGGTAELGGEETERGGEVAERGGEEESDPADAGSGPAVDVDGADVAAIVDVRPWDRPLDARAGDDHERGHERPDYRLHERLRETSARWGVLTNGRRWRLYADRTGHRFDRYYEIDLAALLETGDLDAFDRFYRLFRREAFVEEATGACFLDRVYAESSATARAESEALQERVAQALPVIARGFLTHPDTDLTTDDLDQVRDAALVFLFRLLVGLSAEASARGRDEGAGSRGATASGADPASLTALAREVVDGDETVAGATGEADIRSRLDDLFARIDRGRTDRSPEPGPAGPAYDGWLFRTDPADDDPPVAHLLASTPVDDGTLAEVLELVTTRERDRGGADGSAAGGNRATPIDYASLSPRHLGAIYEELLEYDLAVDESAATVDESIQSNDPATAAVCLRSDDGDRKATGSYYTPAPVVEHVVERTLEPLVDELRADLLGPDGRCDPDYAARFAARVLELDVLDPAMGCGQFLRGALEYLTREIVGARERQAARHGPGSIDGDRDLAGIRRAVAGRCLFGVDLDPIAVELARASLWTATLDADEPAGTLDAGGLTGTLEEHLVTGNALVGTDLEGVAEQAVGTEVADLEAALTAESGRGDPASARRPGDRDPVRRRGDPDSARGRIEAIANVHTAREFDAGGVPADGGQADGVPADRIPADAVERLLAALDDDAEWGRLAATGWFAAAQERAAADRYLHWELAFPGTCRGTDGTRDGGGEPRREEPGFDAVVGNPPWVATAGRAGISATIDGELRSYLADAFETTENQFDCYVAFSEQFVRRSADGRVGIVLPDSVLAREGAAPLRAFVLAETALSEIVRLGTAFEGVEAGAVVLVSGGRGGDGGEGVRCADVSAPSRGDRRETGGEPAIERSIRARLSAPDYTTIPADVFAAQDASRFLLHLDEPTRSLLETVDERPTLGEIVSISRGEELGKRADVLREEPGPGTRPIAPGAAIRRYGLDSDELRHVEPDDVAKDPRQYRSPKLLFRQTSDELVGTFDDEGLVTIKSAYNLRVDGDDRDELLHLLGLLNSSILNAYHRYKHAAYRSVFPQINQSTFEAFPVAIADGPDPELVDAVERRLELAAERSGIDLHLPDYLGAYEPGPSLWELPACRPAAGVDGTKLSATTAEWPNLRLGEVAVETEGERTVIWATVRYKPDDRTTPTDRWGYAETEPIPALVFDGTGPDGGAVADGGSGPDGGVDPDGGVEATAGLTDERRLLVETFVPYAAAEVDGVASLRLQATKTTSPLDRVRALTLPRLEDVRTGLREFAADRERAAELDAAIATVDRRIDERVADLYDLSGAERELVRRERSDRVDGW